MLKLYHELSIQKNWERKYFRDEFIQNQGRQAYEDHMRRQWNKRRIGFLKAFRLIGKKRRYDRIYWRSRR